MDVGEYLESRKLPRTFYRSLYNTVLPTTLNSEKRGSKEEVQEQLMTRKVNRTLQAGNLLNSLIPKHFSPRKAQSTRNELYLIANLFFHLKSYSQSPKNSDSHLAEIVYYLIM